MFRSLIYDTYPLNDTYIISMISIVHISALVSQFWPRQTVHNSLAHRSTVATSLKDHRPCLLCMRTNVFVGLNQVRIVEVALYMACLSR